MNEQLAEEQPPHWLSVAVRKHLVLVTPQQVGTGGLQRVDDFRCTAVTEAIWEAFKAEQRRVIAEGVAEYQREYERQRANS